MINLLYLMGLKNYFSINQHRFIHLKKESIYKKKKYNINSIIENYDLFKDTIKRKQLSFNFLDNLDFIYNNKSLYNNYLDKINALNRQKLKINKRIKNENDFLEFKQDSMKIKDEIKNLESENSSLLAKIYECVESLPAILDQTVPLDAKKGDVVQYINCKSEKDAYILKPILHSDHKKLNEIFSLINFDSASMVSGSSWYYLLNDGALLENALIQYSLQKAFKHGYKFVIPPSVVRNEIIDACGYKPDDKNNESQTYKIQNKNLSLIGTAEIPIAALHISSTFNKDQKFPVKYVGLSRSYRAEAGARGLLTKGLYRVHEFTKVELFHFTTPDKENIELNHIKDIQVEIIKDLGLIARVINMPSSDLGVSAKKKYDCEAWMPGKKCWGELTSTSNCGDYQSKKLNIYYINSENETTNVSTINGTCIAVPRFIIAIMEQNYDKILNKIKIPNVLIPFMNGKKYISKD